MAWVCGMGVAGPDGGVCGMGVAGLMAWGCGMGGAGPDGVTWRFGMRDGTCMYNICRSKNEICIQDSSNTVHKLHSQLMFVSLHILRRWGLFHV